MGAIAEAEAAYEAAVTLARTVALPFMTIEPLAGLVRVALAQPGDRLPDGQYLAAYLEEILAFLTQTAGDGLEEPFRVYLTCYQGLQARADALLAQAYERLQQRAVQIDDPTMQHSFLEHVAANRHLRRTAHIVLSYETTLELAPT